MTSTMKVRDQTYAIIRHLAEELNRPMVDILDEAIEVYRRQQFFAELESGFQALRDDPEAWQAYRDEIRAWDITLRDGLE